MTYEEIAKLYGHQSPQQQEQQLLQAIEDHRNGLITTGQLRAILGLTWKVEPVTAEQATVTNTSFRQVH